jgi:AcrR family transcriptional regulator
VTYSADSENSSWAAPKTRIRRPDAEQALIGAVIELMDTLPIADITIHQIAQVAGVNFGYINRYFESRHNLFATASDVLADIGMAQLHTPIESSPSNSRGSKKYFSLTEIGPNRIAVTPIGVKRLQLIQYLVSAGVPADRFVPKSKEVIDSAVSAAIQVGFSPEVARSRVLHVISLLWAKATLGPVFGVTGDELESAFTNFFAETSANPKEKPKK